MGKKMKTRKVFCKNCLFDYGRHAETCHPFFYVKSKWYGGYVRDYKTSIPIKRSDCNKDNNCPYYEKNRWRFWV